MNSGDEAARRALGRVLRELRRARGLSQERLAHAADVARTYVGSVDRGERNPSFEHLLRLLRALGVSWTELGAALEREEATRVAPPPPGGTAGPPRPRGRVRRPALRAAGRAPR